MVVQRLLFQKIVQSTVIPLGSIGYLACRRLAVLEIVLCEEIAYGLDSGKLDIGGGPL